MFHLVVQVCIAALANAAIPSAVIVGAACGLMWLRSWSATTRCCMWSVALTAIVILPFVVPFLPSRRVAVSTPASKVQYVPKLRVQRSTAVRIATQPARIDWSTVEDFVAVGAASCVLIQLLRLWVALVAALRLKRGATALRCICLRRRSVSIASSDRVSSPLTVGYVRPIILLPTVLVATLEHEQLEQVVAHELAHVARWDDWAIAIERILAALFTFHPLVRFVCWRMDLDRELACDDQVLASTAPTRYASCLTRIAELVLVSRR